MSVFMALQTSLAFSGSLLFLADRETSLFQRWLNDSHDFPYLHPVKSPLKSGGTVLHGFLVTDRPSDSPAPDRPDRWTDLCQRQRTQIVVALGEVAAQAAVQACQLPTLSVGITHREATSLLAKAQHHSLSVIYLEAEPLLNLRLVRALLPAARTVGVFVPPDPPAWLLSLRAEAQRLQFTLDEMAVMDDQETVRTLRARLSSLDAVLLPPEPTLINEWSLKPLLLMTMRQGIPTVGGLTARYVKAGVLAGVVADEDRLPEQMQSFITQLVQGKTPIPAYPTAVRVVINRTVAQTLGISTEAVEHTQSLFSRF